MDDLTFWELNAAVTGWGKVHGAPEGLQPPADSEHDDMVRRLG